MVMYPLDFIAPLFVPANRPERFAKAAASGADAIILDLEDAVPADVKADAREALTASFTNLPVLVRVNPAGTRWFEGDVAAVTGKGFAAIMLPKADGASVAALSQVSTGNVVALIESALGLAEVRAIAAHSIVVRLAFGSIDYAVDLGMEHTRDTLLTARSELVLASRLAGKLSPIDGVTVAINDNTLVTDDARHARALGFSGKLCIHPKQIAPVIKGFVPTDSEIAWARKVLASDDGAVNLDGEMVDEPVRIRARKILQRVT